MPPSRRNIKIEAVLRDNAHPICVPINRGIEMRVIGRRPKCSERGPHRIGPIRNPSTNRDITTAATSEEKVKYASSWRITPAGMELANVLINAAS